MSNLPKREPIPHWQGAYDVVPVSNDEARLARVLMQDEVEKLRARKDELEAELAAIRNSPASEVRFGTDSQRQALLAKSLQHAGVQPIPEAYHLAYEACKTFVEKVEAGSIRSRATYASMKAIVKQIEEGV